jgi:hypothetical protein
MELQTKIKIFGNYELKIREEVFEFLKSKYSLNDFQNCGVDKSYWVRVVHGKTIISTKKLFSIYSKMESNNARKPIKKPDTIVVRFDDATV